MNDKPNIVLVGGTGCGKSTAAYLLAHDHRYARLAFAGLADDPHTGSPRDIVTRAWGPEAINDRVKLIAMANKARDLDPHVWLRSLERELDLYTRAVVVDDCRFENEYFGLKARGFVSIRLTSPLAVRIERLKANGKWLDEEYLDHPIEHHLDAIVTDYTLDNSDTDLNWLGEQLHDIVERERKHR